ncbi:unnamed protein product [Vitrella brassicaformis CCMP3155]|uniref:Protein kinase domain-containing protein n=1 Tax=Vitrella brassicaformis (strain CCMP3155) TaxID=1169540 RepID=A0A0G4ECN0_VITBC|nr:unnamed protein product [Vitrella brassicaformis CCMP3155]|eukprot:CEL93061.1 unnamed protein product [Vitrella brassicaformis CCMP3155]
MWFFLIDECAGWPLPIATSRAGAELERQGQPLFPEAVEVFKTVCQPQSVYCVVSLESSQTELDAVDFWNSHGKSNVLPDIDDDVFTIDGVEYQIKSAHGANAVALFVDIAKGAISSPISMDTSPGRTHGQAALSTKEVIIKMAMDEERQRDIDDEKDGYETLWRLIHSKGKIYELPRIPHYYQPTNPEEADVLSKFLIIERLHGISFADLLGFHAASEIDWDTKVLVRALDTGEERRIAFGTFVIAQLFQGVHSLHQSGLQHCDLKKGNVFLPTYPQGDAAHLGPYRAPITVYDEELYVSTELKPSNLMLIDFSHPNTMASEDDCGDIRDNVANIALEICDRMSGADSLRSKIATFLSSCSFHSYVKRKALRLEEAELTDERVDIFLALLGGPEEWQKEMGRKLHTYSLIWRIIPPEERLRALQQSDQAKRDFLGRYPDKAAVAEFVEWLSECSTSAREMKFLRDIKELALTGGEKREARGVRPSRERRSGEARREKRERSRSRSPLRAAHDMDEGDFGEMTMDARARRRLQRERRRHAEGK